MRLLLKILFTPVILILTVFVWLCMGLLYCSAFLFGLAASIVALLGLAALVTYSVQNGIILLVIAFLVSPMGLPMVSENNLPAPFLLNTTYPLYCFDLLQ